MGDLAEFDSGFSTGAMREVWSTAARVQHMLDVELALTEAAASVGRVPQEALARVRLAATQPVADPHALIEAGWKFGTPVIPLVALLRERVGEGAASYVHLGATSQDILDTALVLQLRQSFRELRALLGAVADELHALLVRHPDAWVMARTLLQPALPIRFSVRIAHWLDPMLAQIEALEVASKALPIQLGGPVGDLAAFGDAADAVSQAFARLLQLRAPALPWHTDRSVVVHAVELVLAAAKASANVANNLLLLSQPEVGEMRIDPSQAGASSSLPNKQNAHHAVRALSTLRACQSAASVVTAAHPHELERAAGSWQAEGFGVPLSMHCSAATVEATLCALRASSFDSARATANLGSAKVHDDAHGRLQVERVTARYLHLRKKGS